MTDGASGVVRKVQELSKIRVPMKVQFARFVLDMGREQLLRDGAAVPLTRKAFEVLKVLVERRPDVVNKQTIADAVWGEAITDAALTVVVAEIRKALDDSATKPRYIRTATGRGYAFCFEDQAPAGLVGPVRYFLSAQGRRFALPEGELIVGRDSTCEIRLDDPSVSRRHALLTVRGVTVNVEDLQSTNGILINGRRPTGRVLLASGDRIQLGSVDTLLEAVGSSEGRDTVRLPGH